MESITIGLYVKQELLFTVFLPQNQTLKFEVKGHISLCHD